MLNPEKMNFWFRMFCTSLTVLGCILPPSTKRWYFSCFSISSSSSLLSSLVLLFSSKGWKTYDRILSFSSPLWIWPRAFKNGSMMLARSSRQRSASTLFISFKKISQIWRGIPWAVVMAVSYESRRIFRSILWYHVIKDEFFEYWLSFNN